MQTTEMSLSLCNSHVCTDKAGREGANTVTVDVPAQEDSVSFFITPLPPFCTFTGWGKRRFTIVHVENNAIINK